MYLVKTGRNCAWHCVVFISLFAAQQSGDSARAQSIPSPKAFLGHRVGEDYKLARWEKVHAYFRAVAEASSRVNLREIGASTNGRPMIYAEISAAETIAEIPLHRRNQKRLADPRTILSDVQAEQLASDSKVVVLINCGLHASEVAASQMSMELLHDLATDRSDRVREILDRTITLLVPCANPDGLDIVAEWYDSTIGKPWEGSGLPFLYHHYAGHDNNRDWFMLNLDETRHLTEVKYKDWYPTVVYDVHQMGNRGARFFVPPFHDPKNANVPPLIDQTLMIVGGHMAQDLSRAEKTGVIHGAIYDNWWAGGFRTTVYRHNMVGILTEAASANLASPIFQRKSELGGHRRGLPQYRMTTNFPEPWPGGWWRLRDVVEYQKISCLALLNYAARNHDTLQSNYLHLGRQAIERGRTEPPYAWLVPGEQRDPATASWMLDLLQQTGIEIHQAAAPFKADGVEYSAGTHIMYCAQPYRAHLMDMMERQVYPDRELYPGGPAEPPYDMAGWTLPLQMGVRRVAVARPFQAAIRDVETIRPPQGQLKGAESANHFVILAGANDDFRLRNRLAKLEIPVGVYQGLARGDWQLEDDRIVPPGSLVIEDAERLQREMPEVLDGVSVSPWGLEVIPLAVRNVTVPANAPRIGLYQPWIPSMDEGWTRYVLDRFEYDYTSVHNADVLAGRLAERYDCLVIPSIPPQFILSGRAPDATAPPYVGGLGPDGVIALQEFVEAGGTLVCIDQSTNLAIEHFGIPVTNLVRGKRSEEFYCPGSVLRVRSDPTHPLGWGLPEWISGYFARSQAFELGAKPTEGAASETKSKPSDTNGARQAAAPAPAIPHAPRDRAPRHTATAVARYSDTVLLESGWIRGEELIRDRPCVVEVDYGEGRIILLGFGVQRRAQPHGTFRLLFNAMQRSTL